MNKEGEKAENITDVILRGATVVEATQESLADALVMVMKELATQCAADRSCDPPVAYTMRS